MCIAGLSESETAQTAALSGAFRFAAECAEKKFPAVAAEPTEILKPADTTTVGERPVPPVNRVDENPYGATIFD